MASARGYAVAVAAALALGCSDRGRGDGKGLFRGEEAPPTRSAGTERMVRRLALLAENSAPMANAFMNGERLAYLRQRPLPGDEAGRVRAQLELANEMLRAGSSEEAAVLMDAILAEVAEDPGRHPPGLARRIRKLLAVSHLRIGEQENCLLAHNSDSCLLPIRESGVHRLKEGSRAALDAYASLLRDDPGDLMSRWLFNVAAMTLGEYPHGVPDRWRIPPEAFASEHDIGRFPDVATSAGLATVALAGGCVVEDLDGDGYLDLVVSSWGLEDPLRYFRNRRDGTFEERTREAGLEGLVGGLNLVHADYDNDGDVDLLVLRGAWMQRQGRHPNSLLANDGGGLLPGCDRGGRAPLLPPDPGRGLGRLRQRRLARPLHRQRILPR